MEKLKNDQTTRWVVSFVVAPVNKTIAIKTLSPIPTILFSKLPPKIMDKVPTISVAQIWNNAMNRTEPWRLVFLHILGLEYLLWFDKSFRAQFLRFGPFYMILSWPLYFLILVSIVANYMYCCLVFSIPTRALQIALSSE